MSQSQARAMGVAVHAALARFGPGMAAEQAAAALAPFRGTLGRLRYERLLKHLADRDLIPGYWSARLRLCEQPVVTNMPEKPGELLLGVCDVLLQDAAGSWRLYDYKTGGAAEAEESRAQVRLYAKMLAPHLDGPLARLGVVDVETGTVVEVEA
jgi:ATP-dependent exoDNAse (exonuclease V) beta subunit